MSSLCSDTADDVLWGINDVEEDENEAVEDISKIPKSLSWISSKKGYESYRKVLERIALNTYGHLMRDIFSCKYHNKIRRNKKDGGCRFYHNALRT